MGSRHVIEQADSSSHKDRGEKNMSSRTNNPLSHKSRDKKEKHYMNHIREEEKTKAKNRICEQIRRDQKNDSEETPQTMLTPYPQTCPKLSKRESRILKGRSRIHFRGGGIQFFSSTQSENSGGAEEAYTEGLI